MLAGQRGFVKHIGISEIRLGTLQFSGSLRVNDALYPSKSGLINKHTVKHTEESVRQTIRLLLMW